MDIHNLTPLGYICLAFSLGMFLNNIVHLFWGLIRKEHDPIVYNYMAIMLLFVYPFYQMVQS